MTSGTSDVLAEAREVPCAHCMGTGRVHLPPEIDTLEVYYFGCWKDLGHFWVDPKLSWSYGAEKKVPEELRQGRIDGGYCPGAIRGDAYKRSRPEVEGEARLSHVSGWTVLGWWDRSVDRRGACNSNIVARGTHGFTTMLEIGRRHMPHVMARQRQAIMLVEGAALWSEDPTTKEG